MGLRSDYKRDTREVGARRKLLGKKGKTLDRRYPVLHRVNLRQQKRARNGINNRCTQIVWAIKKVRLAAAVAVSIATVGPIPWRASILMSSRMDTATNKVTPGICGAGRSQVSDSALSIQHRGTKCALWFGFHRITCIG